MEMSITLSSFLAAWILVPCPGTWKKSSPSVILVMLHVKLPPQLTRRGHKHLSEAVRAGVQCEMVFQVCRSFTIHRCLSQMGCQRLQSEINEVEVKIRS
uniref:Secreted protein n=1 Tax=Athene cunicularia TaxID=194338 RepID=A0A663MA85_ATHCN